MADETDDTPRPTDDHVELPGMPGVFGKFVAEEDEDETCEVRLVVDFLTDAEAIGAADAAPSEMYPSYLHVKGEQLHTFFETLVPFPRMRQALESIADNSKGYPGKRVDAQIALATHQAAETLWTELEAAGLAPVVITKIEHFGEMRANSAAYAERALNRRFEPDVATGRRKRHDCREGQKKALDNNRKMQAQDAAAIGPEVERLIREKGMSITAAATDAGYRLLRADAKTSLRRYRFYQQMQAVAPAATSA